MVRTQGISPVSGPSKVRVRVHMSVVNPSNAKQRSSWAGDSQIPFPSIVPHNKEAGEIDVVGFGFLESRTGSVSGLYEAQRDGRVLGTAAESVILPGANAVPRPANATFDGSASLDVPGMTVHRSRIRAGFLSTFIAPRSFTGRARAHMVAFDAARITSAKSAGIL
jgi:NADPH:quinone reductase